jgi:glycosyltransferase involved in cell wall biosynthesis
MKKVKQRRFKIAIFHCGFIYSGGGERIVLEEISGLQKRGYKVDCYVPTYDSRLSYPDIIERFEIKTFLPQLPRWFPLRFATQIVASCLLAPLMFWRFLDYDIFLGANQPGAYMAWVIAGILRKPYFVYLSQPNRVLYPRNHEDWQNVFDYYFLNKIINIIFKKPVEILDRLSITKGKALFINGSFVAKEIVAVYKPRSWIDCPGGAHLVEKELLRINRKEGSFKIENIKVKKPYILFTSRHEPWKRFDWAIEIFAKALKKYPNFYFVIPGSAETTVTPKLRYLAKKLGIEDRVIFIISSKQKQKDLWKIYKNAYAYIFTSEKEDLGIVVQEAQANYLPVLAWRVGGPTVTVKDKITGFLIDPYDHDRMAEKLVFLLENPEVRDKMGKAAWEHIKENFSWERHVSILEKEFSNKDTS